MIEEATRLGYDEGMRLEGKEEVVATIKTDVAAE